jgi:ABC-type sugar transport system ATPase subunit
MIQVKNLSKQFDKRGIAGIHNMSFDLDQGKIMAIMGPNGSGKTTLLKILSGSVKQEHGDFQIDGNVSFFPREEAPEDQNVQKFLVNAVTIDIEEEKKIQLSRDLADTFEFTFQLKQRLSELSSGQKQKILLAKELINRPRLFLMDEPFSHLDPFTRRDILKGLFSYIKNQKITVLWVTHDLDEAFYFADIMALMNLGKVEQLADPLTMVRSPKNLFVAKFMGYRNFFPVKASEDSWVTPWGKIQLTGKESAEMLLVVPDRAWDTADGLGVAVVGIHAGKQCTEYSLTYQDRTLFLQKDSRAGLFTLGEGLTISPRWDECFLIPL